MTRLRHDMRTPLNQIIGYCDLWLEGGEEDAAAAERFRPQLEQLRAAGLELLTRAGCTQDSGSRFGRVVEEPEATKADRSSGGWACVASGSCRPNRRRRSHPGRRRQSVQSRGARPPAPATGAHRRRSRQRPASPGTAGRRAVRPGPARHPDAGDERPGSARPAQGRRPAAAPAGHHDLGPERHRQRRPLPAGRGRRLSAPAVQRDDPAGPGRRPAGAETAAGPRGRAPAGRSKREKERVDELLHVILPAEAVRRAAGDRRSPAAAARRRGRAVRRRRRLHALLRCPRAGAGGGRPAAADRPVRARSRGGRRAEDQDDRRRVHGRGQPAAAGGRPGAGLRPLRGRAGGGRRSNCRRTGRCESASTSGR